MANDIWMHGMHSLKLVYICGSPLVLQHLVGRLIGKQGRYVSFLKQSSGAKIYISTLPYTQEFQICHIEGKSVSLKCHTFPVQP